jgi:DNA modification methylase
VLGALGRVLRKDGTIWWNLGDTYMTRTIARTSSRDRVSHYAGKRTRWAGNPYRRFSAGHPLLKDKDLTLIPFHVAVGAQQLGFWVRSAIVWSKQARSATGDHGAGARAHVPEVVGDRPVVGHEYVLMLAKSETYAYYPTQAGETANGDRTPLNVRSVWTFPPVTGNSPHGARFPEELPRRCILLATKPRNLVFDPFAGEGTTLVVARDLRRRFLGCEISPTYVAEARRQLLKLDPDLSL